MRFGFQVTVLLLFLSFFNCQAGNERIRYMDSETVSFIHFITCVAEADNPSLLMKQIFLDNRQGNEDEAYLERLKQLFSELPRTIEILKDEKNTYKKPLRDILYIYAASADDLEEFYFLLSSIIPSHRMAEMIRLLDYFYPEFRRIFYNPIRDRLSTVLEDLNSSGAMKVFNEVFTLEKQFFGVKNEQKIRIALVPIFVREIDIKRYREMGLTSFKAEPFGPLQVLENPVISSGEKVTAPFVTKLSGIAMHELSHYCFSMSEQVELLEKELLQFDPFLGFYAYTYINEALATAIGNGYYAIQTNSGTLKESWYSSPIIESYAKAIYPVVRDWLEQGRRLDSEFANKAFEIFSYTFENAHSMPGFLLLKTRLLVYGLDNEKAEKLFYRSIRKHLPCYFKSDPDPVGSKFLITDRTSIEEAEKEAGFDQGWTTMFAGKKGNFYLSDISTTSSPCTILLVVDSIHDIQSCIDLLFSEKHITRYSRLQK